MRVRVILNEPFAGITNGWSLRYINLLLELLPHAELHVFAPGQAAALQAALPGAHIHTTGDETRSPPPKKSLLGFFRSLLTPRVDNLHVGGFYFYPSLFQALKQDTQRYDADLFFHSSSIIFYGAAAKSPLRICDFCDSRIRALRGQLGTATSLVQRCMLSLDIFYTRRFKQRLVPDDVHVVAITERDCDEIRRALPGHDVTCVPNGVRSIDREQLETEIPQRHRSQQLIFFGTLYFPPNVDAAQRLLATIWPTVHTQRPELQLAIVGRHPTQGLKQLASATPAARIESDVPQIEPYLRQSVLSVCPMFMGAGMKNKILESLAVGLPIVATPEAVAGIDFVSERHGWLADTEQQLARLLIDGTRLSEARYRELSLAAHDLALRSSWKNAAAPIVELLNRGDRR